MDWHINFDYNRYAVPCHAILKLKTADYKLYRRFGIMALVTQTKLLYVITETDDRSRVGPIGLPSSLCNQNQRLKPTHDTIRYDGVY